MSLISLPPLLFAIKLNLLSLLLGACQFPNQVATTIQCDHTGDVAFVDFDRNHSALKFQKRTNMTALWQSQKDQGIPPQTTGIETNVVGDDLYIRCHAGRPTSDESSGQDDVPNSLRYGPDSTTNGTRPEPDSSNNYNGASNNDVHDSTTMENYHYGK